MFAVPDRVADRGLSGGVFVREVRLTVFRCVAVFSRFGHGNRGSCVDSELLHISQDSGSATTRHRSILRLTELLRSDVFRFPPAVFYQSLKSKVGLPADKAAAE